MKGRGLDIGSVSDGQDSLHYADNIANLISKIKLNFPQPKNKPFSLFRIHHTNFRRGFFYPSFVTIKLSGNGIIFSAESVNWFG